MRVGRRSLMCHCLRSTRPWFIAALVHLGICAQQGEPINGRPFPPPNVGVPPQPLTPGQKAAVERAINLMEKMGISGGGGAGCMTDPNCDAYLWLWAAYLMREKLQQGKIVTYNWGKGGGGGGGGGGHGVNAYAITLPDEVQPPRFTGGDPGNWVGLNAAYFTGDPPEFNPLPGDPPPALPDPLPDMVLAGLLVHEAQHSVEEDADNANEDSAENEEHAEMHESTKRFYEKVKDFFSELFETGAQNIPRVAWWHRLVAGEEQNAADYRGR